MGFTVQVIGSKMFSEGSSSDGGIEDGQVLKTWLF